METGIEVRRMKRPGLGFDVLLMVGRGVMVMMVGRRMTVRRMSEIDTPPRDDDGVGRCIPLRKRRR